MYSSYYSAVSALITQAINEELSKKNAAEIINSKAFRESFLYIIEAIQNEEWKLITKDYRTPLKHEPQRPLTLLELRFLKAIARDPRFSLFCDGPGGLDDIAPKRLEVVSATGEFSLKDFDLSIFLKDKELERQVDFPRYLFEYLPKRIFVKVEVASTRSLLNTARLMEENTTLYKLKELEYLEKICDNVGSITVSGGSDLLSQLTHILKGA